MAIVSGIRFKDAGKVYYFDPGELVLRKGDYVLVETARGVECGAVSMGNREVPDSEIVPPLKKVMRRATDADLRHVEENERREKEAFAVCEKKILEHKMDMKLVDVEYTFDNNKILFYFTADGRVDFRNLVKDLAAVFRTRIELRQIGVRDEAKMLGGLGICGRPFCCTQFLGDFQPVSIKMAKEQGLSLNPVKISGTCGRLMCCLKYEQNAYDDLLRNTPRLGAVVTTPDGRGIVIEQSLIAGTVKVRPERDPDAAPKVYAVADVKSARAERPRTDADAADAPDENPETAGTAGASEPAAAPEAAARPPRAERPKGDRPPRTVRPDRTNRPQRGTKPERPARPPRTERPKDAPAPADRADKLPERVLKTAPVTNVVRPAAAQAPEPEHTPKAPQVLDAKPIPAAEDVNKT